MIFNDILRTTTSSPHIFIYKRVRHYKKNSIQRQLSCDKSDFSYITVEEHKVKLIKSLNLGKALFHSVFSIIVQRIKLDKTNDSRSGRKQRFYLQLIIYIFNLHIFVQISTSHFNLPQIIHHAPQKVDTKNLMIKILVITLSIFYLLSPFIAALCDMCQIINSDVKCQDSLKRDLVKAEKKILTIALRSSKA